MKLTAEVGLTVRVDGLRGCVSVRFVQLRRNVRVVVDNITEFDIVRSDGVPTSSRV